MSPESLTTFDRRGARAEGSQPAPLLVLACCHRLQKSQQQKTKNKTKNYLHKFLYKTEIVALAACGLVAFEA
jgi:hypothetical protein